MFLSATELADLTGYVRPSAQVRWLQEKGWPFTIGGDGQPKVLRRLVEEKLGGSPAAMTNEPRLRLA